jgi:IS5 family transposase
LQFYYDLSDRQLEERLHYDIVFKLFCNFTLENETPDHTYFCWIRKVLGTERVAKVFRVINEKAKDKKILRSVFSFVDSSHIKVKETTWEERDKAIAD